jgi:hypothetical protein
MGPSGSTRRYLKSYCIAADAAAAAVLPLPLVARYCCRSLPLPLTALLGCYHIVALVSITASRLLAAHCC